MNKFKLFSNNFMNKLQIYKNCFYLVYKTFCRIKSILSYHNILQRVAVMVIQNKIVADIFMLN